MVSDRNALRRLSKRIVQNRQMPFFLSLFGKMNPVAPTTPIRNRTRRVDAFRRWFDDFEKSSPPRTMSTVQFHYDSFTDSDAGRKDNFTVNATDSATARNEFLDDDFRALDLRTLASLTPWLHRKLAGRGQCKLRERLRGAAALVEKLERPVQWPPRGAVPFGLTRIGQLNVERPFYFF